jgi:uncharacterized protein (TIGR03083 family)
MADLAAVYDESRQRISCTVAALDSGALATPAPSTPGWSIADLVSHLTGDLVALLAGDLPENFFTSLGDPAEVAALNTWTERMVRERRGRAINDVLDEWAALTPRAWSLLGSAEQAVGVMGFADRVLTTDIAVHEQDVYGALGVVRERNCAALRIATSFYVNVVGLRLDGLPPVHFMTEQKTYHAGDGQPAATARVDRFELFRALSGRRSSDQIRDWEWTGDPDPYLPLFYLYGPRTEPLVEPV